mgnify:CR=1 FL=1
MEDLQNGLKKMKTKDKLGHDVINGHTIHEFKDYLCIVCFEYEIKEQERERFKKIIEKIDFDNSYTKNEIERIKDVLFELKLKLEGK